MSFDMFHLEYLAALEDWNDTALDVWKGKSAHDWNEELDSRLAPAHVCVWKMCMCVWET